MEHEDTMAPLSGHSTESNESVVSVVECFPSALKANSTVDRNQTSLVNKSVQTIQQVFSSSDCINELRNHTDHLHEQMTNTINFLEHSTSPLEIKSLGSVSSNTKEYILEYENEVQTQKKKFINILHVMLPTVKKIKCLIPFNNEERDRRSPQSLKSPTRREDTPTTSAKPKDTYVKILKSNDQINTSIGLKSESKFDDNIHNLRNSTSSSSEIVPMYNKRNYKIPDKVYGYEAIDKILSDKKHILSSTKPIMADVDLSESNKNYISVSNVENYDNGTKKNEEGSIDNKKSLNSSSKKFDSSDISVTSQSEANIEGKYNVLFYPQTNILNHKQSTRSLSFDFADYISALRRKDEKYPCTKRQLESMKDNSSSPRFDFLDYYSKVMNLRTKYDNLKKIRSCRVSNVQKAALNPPRNKVQVEHHPNRHSEVQNRFYKDFEGYFEKLKNCKGNANVDQAKYKQTSSSNSSFLLSDSKNSIVKFHPQKISSPMNLNKKLVSPCSKRSGSILVEKKEMPTSISNTFRNLVQRFSPSRYFRKK